MPAVRTRDIDASPTFPLPGPRRTSRKLCPRRDSSSELTSLDSDDDNCHHPSLFLPSHRSQRRASTGTSVAHLHSPEKNGQAPKATKTRSPAALAERITIQGVTLHPTVVFDTFWRFAAERKAIDDRRRSGMPPPWTNDPILQRYPFCNTYRVCDKLCQYIIREVVEKGSQDPTEIVFRVILFNTFTKIETWELLQKELGPLTWRRYNHDAYESVLAKAKEAGTTLYTGAFLKPAPHFKSLLDAHSNHLCLLEVLMECDLPGRIRNAEYLAQVFEYLVSFPSMGEFSTFQLMLNLSYSKVLNFSNFDFVIPGPGASSGLGKMFGRAKMKQAKQDAPGIEEAIIRWLAANQKQQFERLGLEPIGLGPDRLPMDLADIEHLLCEVDKYSRQAHPQFKGTRTELRGNFTPSPGVYPSIPTLPKAWSHPARKIVRIRPGGPPVIEKRYTVSHIGAHRKGVDGGTEYKVYWEGYPDSKATWEPELSLVADTPGAVKEYLAQIQKREK
ncbi:hypothetical protein Hypma_013317 [Hypsizygus marmoreus]|uniref:Chromo domain-containing protein n=1 Tax=Hypsizygus marmoreus TaxID=39966 RepID=A0A369JLL1_HYPMA|nr:hypothetical protein Hypma_013317 [Hypsizygus marmoreus]